MSAHGGISTDYLAAAWPEAMTKDSSSRSISGGELISAAQLGIVPRPSRDVTTPARATPEVGPRTDVRQLAELEKQMIVDALRRANGNKSRAAAALGLSRTRLLRRLRRFGLTA